MFDREILVKHIQDIELKNKINKILDKAKGVLKNHDIRYTEFLNPYEIKNSKIILQNIQDISYIVSGGYDDAERNIISIYPHYMSYEDIYIPLKLLQISGKFLFKDISHRDVLGSLLSLGIKREKVGDILINDDTAQVIVSEDICDFITYNLNKISNINVNAQEIGFEKIKVKLKEYKEFNLTVSSLRLDNIISSIYNISRNESSNLIESKKVSVDFEVITNKSKIIDTNSIISIKGKGRCIMENTMDFTKKDRIKIKAKKLL